MILQDAACMSQGISWGNGAVSLHLKHQLLEVGLAADACGLDEIPHVPDGRENGINRDRPEGLVRHLVLICGDIPLSSAQAKLELKFGILVEGGNMRVGIENL